MVIHERAVSGTRSSFTLFLKRRAIFLQLSTAPSAANTPWHLSVSSEWCKCRSNATEDDGSAVARRVAVHDKFIATDLKDYGAYNDGAS